MIRLQRITTADTDLYSYMEKLMTQSFPSEEYRELEELRKYTDTKTHFYNNIIFHNNTMPPQFPYYTNQPPYLSQTYTKYNNHLQHSIPQY